MTHPGKKLMFMGGEIGQFREWDFENEIEWFLLDYPKHAQLQHYAAALNRFYLESPALYQRDDSWAGFTWLDADNCDQSLISYRRRDAADRELVVILNFTPVKRECFRQGLPYRGIWREVFNSDRPEFGGTGVENPGDIRTEDVPMHGEAQSAVLTVPPLGALVLSCRRRTPKRQKK